MELNVWRPSNGVWYLGGRLRARAEVHSRLAPTAIYPFAPDMDGDGDGDFVVFRPSTGTWYGSDPAFSIAWGQPGDIPAPRSVLTGIRIKPRLSPFTAQRPA